MAFTRHGHQIIGTTYNPRNQPPIERCGGPSLCNQCARDAIFGMGADLPEEEERVSITPSKFVRKPFPVEGVRVTAENMAKVAEWCGGTICTMPQRSGTPVKYILVKVLRPLNDRQTKAFGGDWVLFAGISGGHKVYTNRAFLDNFDPFIGDDPNYGEMVGANCD